LAHLQAIPLHQHWTVRCLDDYPGTPRARVIGARGPFNLADERALFAAGQFDVLISKNSGSSATEPKLQVARELGLPVLLLARPPLPPVDRQFSAVEDVWSALQALPGRLG
jgi:precorrin-6A/cobalt-precorrin-6A reductase